MAFLKIAYCIESIDKSGGMERVLSTKANYFAEYLHYEVHIIVGGKKPDSLFFHFSEKIHFHYLNLVFPKRTLAYYFLSSNQDKLYKKEVEVLLMKIKPDITISTFGVNASFLYKIKDGSRKILEFHFTKNYLQHLGDSLEKDKYRGLRKFWLKFLSKREEYLASKYKHVVLLTEHDKILWGGDDKFEVIFNPLSFNTQKSSPLTSNIIVSMGRLVYPKGFQYLIRAFSLIHERYPEWKVEIYGDGHDKDLFQNEINELSLQNKIFLKKPNKNVEEVMLNASICVFPSLYDGFGLVLTEAMVCGVPCIAFDCECGPSEIITNGEDGYLVELKNTRLMAEKMELLMLDKNLRTQMGKNARKNLERFTIEIIANKWHNYFLSLMK